jgi:plasmid stabilization system protein ParE
MKFMVIIMPAAEDNISAEFDFIHERSPLNAERWVRGLYDAIESLELFPNRCGLARESECLSLELRQYIYHSHRIIFQVDALARIVHILHVRHGAMRAIGEAADESAE